MKPFSIICELQNPLKRLRIVARTRARIQSREREMGQQAHDDAGTGTGTAVQQHGDGDRPPRLRRLSLEAASEQRRQAQLAELQRAQEQ